MLNLPFWATEVEVKIYKSFGNVENNFDWEHTPGSGEKKNITKLYMVIEERNVTYALQLKKKMSLMYLNERKKSPLRD